jgi:hypothetical protein
MVVTQPMTGGKVIGQLPNPFVGSQQQPWGKTALAGPSWGKTTQVGPSNPTPLGLYSRQPFLGVINPTWGQPESNRFSSTRKYT